MQVSFQKFSRYFVICEIDPSSVHLFVLYNGEMAYIRYRRTLYGSKCIDIQSRGNDVFHFQIFALI